MNGWTGIIIWMVIILIPAVTIGLIYIGVEKFTTKRSTKSRVH